MVCVSPAHSGSSSLSSERGIFFPAEGLEKGGFAPNAFAPTSAADPNLCLRHYGMERFFILQTLSLPE